MNIVLIFCILPSTTTDLTYRFVYLAQTNTEASNNRAGQKLKSEILNTQVFM